MKMMTWDTAKSGGDWIMAVNEDLSLVFEPSSHSKVRNWTRPVCRAVCMAGFTYIVVPISTYGSWYHGASRFCKAKKKKKKLVTSAQFWNIIIASRNIESSVGERVVLEKETISENYLLVIFEATFTNYQTITQSPIAWLIWASIFNNNWLLKFQPYNHKQYPVSKANQRHEAPRHCTKIVGITLNPTIRATEMPAPPTQPTVSNIWGNLIELACNQTVD